MSVLLQDALVTGIAATAFVTLVWRMVGLLRPSRNGPCTACPSCEAPGKGSESAATVVPLSSVKRRRDPASASR